MNWSPHRSLRQAFSLALAVASILMGGCGAAVVHESSQPPATDLAGSWDYASSNTTTRTAVNLVVGDDGTFRGVVKYGPSLQYQGDVEGQFAAGSLFRGGLIKPRPGSPAPGFDLAASVGTSSITVWRSDSPEWKMQLARP